VRARERVCDGQSRLVGYVVSDVVNRCGHVRRYVAGYAVSHVVSDVVKRCGDVRGWMEDLLAVRPRERVCGQSRLVLLAGAPS